MIVTTVLSIAIISAIFGWTPMVKSVPVQTEPATYISPDSRNCIPCPPAYKVKNHCSQEASESDCEPCPAGEFMSTSNTNTYCSRCQQDSCHKDAFTSQNCTATTDHICKCQEGFHRFPLDLHDDWLNCRKHSPCQEGQGVVHPGSHDKDRECRNCNTKKGPDQEFVNATSPGNPVCQRCSSCQEDWIAVEPCSTNRDTTCSPNGTVPYVTISATTSVPESTERVAELPNTNRLDGGAITGIVVSCLIVASGLTAAIFFCVRKQRKRQRSKKVPHSRTEPSHGPEREHEELLLTSIPQRNGHLQHEDSTVLSEEPVVSQSPCLLQNGGSGEMSWSRDIIIREGFNLLSEALGSHWEAFIRRLPGFQGEEATNVIYFAKHDNQSNVVNAIHDSLIKWSQRHPVLVTQEAICKILREMGLNSILQKLKESIEQKSKHLINQ